MEGSNGKITVFYDGACPRCVKDRDNYERLDPDHQGQVEWFDITGQGEALRQLGIDPRLALTELHIRNANGEILSELDAYRVLMARVPQYRWLGRLISLPLIRPIASHVYHWLVIRRLKKQGRI